MWKVWRSRWQDWDSSCLRRKKKRKTTTFNIWCCHWFPLDHCALLYQVNMYLTDKLHSGQPANWKLNNRVIDFPNAQRFFWLLSRDIWWEDCTQLPLKLSLNNLSVTEFQKFSCPAREHLQTNSHRGCSDPSEYVALFKFVHGFVLCLIMDSALHSNFCEPFVGSLVVQFLHDAAADEQDVSPEGVKYFTYTATLRHLTALYKGLSFTPTFIHQWEQYRV